MSTTKSETYKLLPEFMKRAIDSKIKEATEEEIERAKRRIDQRKHEIISGVVLYIQKQMQVETVGEKLIITIKTE